MNMNTASSSIDNLPEDVLVEIFEYCSPKLLKISALVCKRWSSIISQSPKLMKNFILNLERASTSHVREITNINRRFQNLRTNKISKEMCMAIEILNIRSFELTHFDLSRTAFSKLISRFKHLQHLIIKNVEFTDKDANEPRKIRLNELESLSMTQVQGDVFSLIETTTLKSYKEVVHDSSPFAPIVQFLLQQPCLKVLMLNGGNVHKCFDADRFSNVPFLLRQFIIIGGDLKNSSENIKRFLFTQATLKELIVQCKIHGSLLKFVLKNMRCLETLQIPTKFSDFGLLIDDIEPLPTVVCLKIATPLINEEFAKRYFQLFPSLKAADMTAMPNEARPSSDIVFNLLVTCFPLLEELHIPHMFISTRPKTEKWGFVNLKKLHVEKLFFFDNFVKNHSETLEEISIGYIDAATFSRGTTVQSINFCKKLKRLTIKSDSPLPTRMLKKLSFDKKWQLLSRFPKYPHGDECVEVKFNFPDDEAVWRDNCSFWDENLVREFSTVFGNFGLNLFVNMYK